MSAVYIETYGCQMNFADSEIVASLLQKAGHTVASDIEQADYILINTCAIRDNAEQKSWLFWRRASTSSVPSSNATVKCV